MNKQSYIGIRKQFNLKLKPHMLGWHILQDAALIATSVFLLKTQPDSPWLYLCIPLFAILMFRNFSLMHESVHGLISKNKWINDAAGVVAGGLCLLPYEPWKQIHLEHHYWTGNVDKDPVMALIRTFPNWHKKVQSSVGFFWKAWVPVLALLQYAVFWWHSSVRFLKNPTSSKLLTSVLFPLVLVTGIIYGLGIEYTLTLLIPSVILYLLAVEVVNFPHHIGLPYLDQDDHFHVWDQHISARSCVYPAWLSKYIVLNFNYHIEHHMFPDAAWYYLPELHQAVKEHLKEEYNTDPQFVWIVQNRPKDLARLFEPDQRLKTKKAA